MKLPTPRLDGSIDYDLDYQQQALEGNPGEGTELAIFLPTLVRSASTCGELLELGNLLRLEGRGSGRAFRLLQSAENNRFELWSEVYQGFPAETETTDTPVDFPLLGQPLHLSSFLQGHTGVAWLGFRDSETNHWEQSRLIDDLDEESMQKATMMVLQADILLKGHGLPRRRLHLAFEEGSLTSWAAANDDYFMLLQNTPTSQLSPLIAQAGEAFLLGSVL